MMEMTAIFQSAWNLWDRSFHSSIVEDSGLLGCDAGSLG